MNVPLFLLCQSLWILILFNNHKSGIHATYKSSLPLKYLNKIEQPTHTIVIVTTDAPTLCIQAKKIAQGKNQLQQEKVLIAGTKQGRRAVQTNGPVNRPANS